MKIRQSLSLLLLLMASPLANAGAVVSVRTDQPGARINPAMWGVFFEDINFGADGGLYAELLKNRGFEFPEPLMGWIKISPSLAKGELSVRTDAPFAPANPLVCQRRHNDSHALRWEFPGGKVEEGESHAQALVRELREELGVTAAIGEEIHRTTYKYNELQNELLLIFFWASVEDSATLQNFVFEKFEWADPASLPNYDF